MAALLLLYHCFAFLSLFFLGLYHLVSSIRSFLRPNQSPYSARPYHPLPLPPHRHHLLRHLPLLLSLISILISVTYHLFYSYSSSSSSSFSFSSSAHAFSSLRVVVSLFLFLFLLLLPHPIPSELTFLLASLSFYLLSFGSSSPSSSSSDSSYTDLESKCDSVGSTISLASAGFSLALALFPRLFLADVALSASLLLRGLWALQTGLTLYVEAFVPEGCHLLLDLPEPSTRCDLEESKMRAAELLDLAFALHSAFVAAVVLLVYVAVARGSGPAAGSAGMGIGGLRRSNCSSYEALPTSSAASTGALADLDHVQLKAIGKSSAQA